MPSASVFHLLNRRELSGTFASWIFRTGSKATTRRVLCLDCMATSGEYLPKSERLKARAAGYNFLLVEGGSSLTHRPAEGLLFSHERLWVHGFESRTRCP